MSTIRDRIVELRRVRASELRENPRNWRRHPKHQREVLRALLEEVGFADAILARQADDGSLEIIDGHLRRSMDPAMVVPVLVLDVDEDESAKLLATLDPLASLASADPAPLGELLASMHARSEELRGFLAEVASGAGVRPGAGLTEPDDVPARPSKPVSHAGDLLVLGDHRVICGDAREPGVHTRLLRDRRAAMLVADPPYGVSYQGKTPAALRLANDDEADVGDLLHLAFAAVDEVLGEGAPVYVFHPAGRNALTFLAAIAERWPIRQGLVWRKDSMVLGHGDYHYVHEPIAYAIKPAARRRGRGAGGWFGGNAQTSVFDVARPKASREHPTAKPVALLEGLVTNSAAYGEIVLDPFLGSGSTLIACERAGRRCFGVEIDPAYVDVAARRWEAFTGRRARRYRRPDGR